MPLLIEQRNTTEIHQTQRNRQVGRSVNKGIIFKWPIDSAVASDQTSHFSSLMHVHCTACQVTDTHIGSFHEFPFNVAYIRSDVLYYAVEIVE